MLYLVWFAVILLLAAQRSYAADAQVPTTGNDWQEVTSGTLLMNFVDATTNREVRQTANLVASEVAMTITGVVNEVTLKQTFNNRTGQWAEATYLFPLPHDSAVHHMELRIGERIIIGEIKEKEEAKKIYEKAKSEGKRASLVNQNRPNLFTTKVANIAPGDTIEVVIQYQQVVARNGLEYSIHFPMTHTPRYFPATADPIDMEESTAPVGGVLSGNAYEIAGENNAENHHPYKIEVTLNAGFALGDMEISHPSAAVSKTAESATVTLAPDAHQANEDFKLTWHPTISANPQAYFLTENWNGENYGLLLMTPPQQVASDAILPREVIYIIDTSGSMGGDPIRQARAALSYAIERLRPSDRFNVIEFNSDYRVLFSDAVKADLANKSRAQQWVNDLDASGGTEMYGALKEALDSGECGSSSCDQKYLRQIIFLTDGAIGNEQQLFKLIDDKLGETRLFTVGIGNAPNRYFMEKSAQRGRGTFTYIAQTENVATGMADLFAKIEAPVMSNIAVSVDGARIEALMPSPLPDLYKGEALTALMKLDGTVKEFKVAGEWNGKMQIASVPVTAVEQAGLHRLWAKQTIEKWHDSYQANAYQRGAEGQERDSIRANIVALAIKHHLVSPFTSLVAVDHTPVRPLNEALNSHKVSSNLPKGTHQANFTLSKTATGYQLNLILAALLLMIAALLRIRPVRLFGMVRQEPVR